MGKLDGKKAIITGGARGLGFEIAKEYVREGADILICARDEDALEEACDSLASSRINGTQKILFRKADISDTSDVDELFEYVLAGFGGKLDILVNNAGIQGPIGPFDENDWDEVLNVININLTGTLYCMRKAAGIFKKAASDTEAENAAPDSLGPGTGSASDRYIINISGGGSTGPRPNFMGYAVAKAGIVRATETLAKELEPYGIRVNAIAPGAMNTRMTDEIINAGEKAGEEFEKTLQRKKCGVDTMEKPAALAVSLASDESAGITGRLISAVWDSWQEFASHAEEISGSDIYTLRRIVPGDRGYDW